MLLPIAVVGSGILDAVGGQGHTVETLIATCCLLIITALVRRLFFAGDQKLVDNLWKQIGDLRGEIELLKKESSALGEKLDATRGELEIVRRERDELARRVGVIERGQ